MKTRIAAVVTALVLGVAPISSAMAFTGPAWTGYGPYDVETTGSFDAPLGLYDRNPVTCPMSSAAEGNARQQNFPVQQYGQTAGGNRC
ncbi:hypothetical protein Q8W71_10335 [Methylobacterium sp. NEAU 140]|uniref:hypothetical protein n=1 Tax=Methylobacterium sp. NEAU 140 TaxID=3064945 RepID=UPI0027369A59|nr:hypothetical protein [Methylobacterium sp. NEAU 140]MDP4021883.1 hypothetical protein [Methylobacterium sp. NEAU 140]MDP4023022.1 hypothetical protein [Methylobacterium sp. NEAU 140]